MPCKAAPSAIGCCIVLAAPSKQCVRASTAIIRLVVVGRVSASVLSSISISGLQFSSYTGFLSPGPLTIIRPLVISAPLYVVGTAINVGLTSARLLYTTPLPKSTILPPPIASIESQSLIAKSLYASAIWACVGSVKSPYFSPHITTGL